MQRLHDVHINLTSCKMSTVLIWIAELKEIDLPLSTSSIHLAPWEFRRSALKLNAIFDANMASMTQVMMMIGRMGVSWLASVQALFDVKTSCLNTNHHVWISAAELGYDRPILVEDDCVHCLQGHRLGVIDCYSFPRIPVTEWFDVDKSLLNFGFLET